MIQNIDGTTTETTINTIAIAITHIIICIKPRRSNPGTDKTRETITKNGCDPNDENNDNNFELFKLPPWPQIL